ncbi:MAG: class I SAM-dependent methyltransferase [Patescibacteria group bacterium]
MILTTSKSKDYELIDSGEKEKLEKYGTIILSRPDPQALWEKSNPPAWNTADAFFSRTDERAGWRIKPNVPDRWQIEFGGLELWIRPSAFKHTGLFPEQLSNWIWMQEKIISANRPISVLNLFGYTGGATLAAAKAGAEVCHVDGSKAAVGWAKDNAILSGLSNKPIRWILDDARKFVKRELRRGRQYQGIIMDPPAFGHGPNKELWKIEDHFVLLLKDCIALLDKKPLFVLLNGYASGYSSIAYQNNLLPLVHRFGGSVEAGELTIAESGDSKRLLPCGIFARWSASIL